jgi:mannose-1-phosphate guanylyltransferase
MTDPSFSPLRCGIVLAGGDGARLQSFVHRLTGSTLPKQYVNLIGTRSMLEHTFDRAEKLIHPDRLFTIANENHLHHSQARRQLVRRPKGTVIIQPENKETGPGILLGLMHLVKNYPDSNVAIFPSDHFIVQEDLFMCYVALAFQVVENNPGALIMLGLVPDGPEPEYGYIVPNDEQDDSLTSLRVHDVKLFIEKPGPDLAQELVFQGGLWNTMVMVFNTTIVLDLVRRLAPGLYGPFQPLLNAIGTSKEKATLEEIYGRIEPINFSSSVMEALPLLNPSRASVLPVSGVLWSDWGSEDRIVGALKKTGYLERLQGIRRPSLRTNWSNG